MNYFGEKATTDCGICSYCIKKNGKKNDGKTIPQEIISLLKTEDLSSREIQQKIKKEANDVIFALQQLLENNILMIQPNNKYTLKL